MLVLAMVGVGWGLWEDDRELEGRGGALCLQTAVQACREKIKGFCQKWEVKFSYVQNWLAFAKVGGTVKSKYGQACTSGT